MNVNDFLDANKCVAQKRIDSPAEVTAAYRCSYCCRYTAGVFGAGITGVAAAVTAEDIAGVTAAVTAAGIAVIASIYPP